MVRTKPVHLKVWKRRGVWKPPKADAHQHQSSPRADRQSSQEGWGGGGAMSTMTTNTTTTTTRAVSSCINIIIINQIDLHICLRGRSSWGGWYSRSQPPVIGKQSIFLKRREFEWNWKHQKLRGRGVKLGSTPGTRRWANVFHSGACNRLRSAEGPQLNFFKKFRSQFSIWNIEKCFSLKVSIFRGWPRCYTVAHFGSLIYLGCSIN